LISEIGREPIRRVINRRVSAADLANQAPAGLGVRSFLLTPSSFKQWCGDGIEDADALAAQLKMFVHGEKPGAAPEDMLFELLLKFGQPLNAAVERLEIGGATIYAINHRAMLFTLEHLTFE
jgi:adenine-specific DNA-methyltransferase